MLRESESWRRRRWTRERGDDESMFMCRRRRDTACFCSTFEKKILARFAEDSAERKKKRVEVRGWCRLAVAVVQLHPHRRSLGPFCCMGMGRALAWVWGGMGAFPRLRYLPASIQPSSLLRSHRARSGRFSQPEMPGILLRYVHGL